MESLSTAKELSIKKMLIASIIVLLLLRIYALFFTISINTGWDDRYFREMAIIDANKTTLTDSLKYVFLPNSTSFGDNSRTSGYHWSLVLGLKLFGSDNSEFSFQLINCILFLIQGLTIFFFSYFCLSDKLFTLGVSFLYLSSPLVFGFSRWFMTENFTFTGLLLFSFLSFYLLASYDKKKEKIHEEIIKTALVAYLIGIFFNLREYALPFLVIILISTILGLIIEKRYISAITFIGMLTPFSIATSKALTTPLNIAFSKISNELYFHTLEQWIPHCFVYSSGIGFGIFLMYSFYKILSWKCFNISKEKFNSIHLLFISHFVLLIAYIIGLIFSRARIIRLSVLPIFCLIGFILIGFYIFKPLKYIYIKEKFNQNIKFIIFITFASLTHQLFIAFDGGKKYAHHAYNLEFINYPLNIRPLKDRSDSHGTFQ